MDTESVNTKFTADVSGFVTPVSKALTAIDQMIAKLNRLAAAGDASAAGMAAAAREGANAFTSASWRNPLPPGASPHAPQNWQTFLGDTLQRQAATRIGRVAHSLSEQRSRETALEQKRVQEQADRRQRVVSGLADQRQQLIQEEFARRQRVVQGLGGLRQQLVQEEFDRRQRVVQGLGGQRQQQVQEEFDRRQRVVEGLSGQRQQQVQEDFARRQRVVQGLGGQRQQQVQEESDRRQRVVQGLESQKQEEYARRSHVLSGLATQRVQEEARARAERTAKLKREANQFRRDEEERRLGVRQNWATVGKAGFGGVIGASAGLASGNPFTGMMGGLVGGGFAGGPVGAIAGGLAGLLGGTVGAGIHLLTEGLGLAVNLTKDLVVHTIQLGMEYQKNVAFFSAFTGSDAKARGIMEGLQDTATSSPFKFNQLTRPAGMLMGYGIKPSEINAVVGRLSMVAAGDPTRLERLSLAYAQTQSHGRLMGQEMRQFAESGVGAADFAQTMKITPAELKKRMMRGQVGSDVVWKTLNRLTSPGGRYEEVNTKLLGSVEGRVNQLVETVEIKMGKLGEKMFERFNIADMIGGMTAMFDPLLNQHMPQIESGADAIFNSISDISGLVLDTATSWGTGFAELWNGPFGKMFLPQTWNDFRKLVLQGTGAISLMGGVLLDLTRVSHAAGAGVLAVASRDPAKLAAAALYANAVFNNPAKYAKEAEENLRQAYGEQSLSMRGRDSSSPNLVSRLLAAGRGNTKMPALGLIGFSPSTMGMMGGINSIMSGATTEGHMRENLEKQYTEIMKGNKTSFELKAPLSEFKNKLAGMSKLVDENFIESEAAAKFPGAKPGTPEFGQKIRWIGGQMANAQAAMEAGNFQAFQQLRSAFPSGADSFKLPSFAMADSAEAVKTQIESSFKSSESFEDEIRRLLEEAGEQEKLQTEEMKKFNEFLKNNPLVLKSKKP